MCNENADEAGMFVFVLMFIFVLVLATMNLLSEKDYAHTHKRSVHGHRVVGLLPVACICIWPSWACRCASSSGTLLFRFGLFLFV